MNVGKFVYNLHTDKSVGLVLKSHSPYIILWLYNELLIAKKFNRICTYSNDLYEQYLKPVIKEFN